MSRFCCGVTRPKTVFSSSVSARASGSLGSLRASYVRSAPGSPSFPATAPTETALSPEMTLAATCWSSK